MYYNAAMPKISKYVNDPVLTALVDRIASGEIDRNAAAAEIGVGINTFNSRLGRAKLLDRLAHTRCAKSPSLYRGPGEGSPKAVGYAQAVQRALALGSATRAYKELPDLNYQVLCRKVRAAKAEEAQP